MDLSFTPDQEALREATTRLYAKESHGERVREAEATGFDPALWAAVVAMGLPVMARPRGRRRSAARRSPTWPPPSRSTAPTSARSRSSRRSWPRALLARARWRRAPGADRRRRARHAGPATGRRRPGVAWCRARAVADGRWSPSTATGSWSRATARRRGAAHAGEPGGRPTSTSPAPSVLAGGRRGPRRVRAARSTSGAPSRRSPRPVWRAPPSTPGCSTPRTGTSSACRSAASRRSSTGSPTCTPRVEGSRLLAYEAIWALDEDAPAGAGPRRPGVVVVRRGRRRGGRVQPARARRLRLHARVRRAAARAASQGHPPAARRSAPTSCR